MWIFSEKYTLYGEIKYYDKITYPDHNFNNDPINNFNRIKIPPIPLDVGTLQYHLTRREVNTKLYTINHMDDS